MAAGSDAHVGIGIETTYGTRVPPTRFLPLTAESNGFAQNRYFSPAIGIGRWARPSITTTKGGSGSISGDVPTVGFGYLINGLHTNTVAPVVASGAAYTQTHTLSTPVTRSYSLQVQMPPVTSATLVPHDLIGVVFGGITFSWSDGGVLSYEIPTVIQDLSIAETLASYVAPSAYELLPFSGGSITIGGAAEGLIVGDGSVTLALSLRDNEHYLGSDGKMAKPVENDKPTAEGQFTVDFVDNANITRMLADTQADVVVKFQHPTAITGAHYPYVQLTLPDCKFTTERPTVDGPGLVDQPVTFTAASSTNDPPVIEIKSPESVL